MKMKLFVVSSVLALSTQAYTVEAPQMSVSASSSTVTAPQVGTILSVVGPLQTENGPRVYQREFRVTAAPPTMVRCLYGDPKGSVSLQTLGGKDVIFLDCAVPLAD